LPTKGSTLFAALETLQGKVVGECHERHRHQEFLKFLRLLDTEFPGDVPLHLILDYGTHKHAKVKAWMKRHPRFVLHYVPTSSSWMNLVERWFGHLDNQAIRRGVLLSVADLEASIAAFLKAWNQNPKPFVWTATVDSIQEKLHRCRRTLEQIQPRSTRRPKSRKRKR
jgi:transposase